MTYDAQAQLKSGARPVWLTRIEYAGIEEFYSSATFGYTTGAGVPTADFIGTTVWNAGPLLQKEIKIDSDGQASAEVYVRRDSPAVAAALAARDDETAFYITIWHGYSTDPDDEFLPVFTGVVNKIFPGWASSKLLCIDGSSLYSEKVIGRVLQRLCPYALFSPACGLVAADYEASFSVTAVSGDGLSFTATDSGAVADAYYLYGRIQHGGETRVITGHSGNVVTVLYPLTTPIDIFPATVLLSRGCRKTKSECASFSNSLNFGGFEAMDGNRYDGRALY